MDNEEKIADMEQRVEHMWERMREKDIEAARVIEKKDALLEDFRPLETALLLKTEKLVRLSMEKETMLREAWKHEKILTSLKNELQTKGLYQ